MKNTFKIFLLSLTLLMTVSCQDTNPLYGEWKLLSWNVGVDLDLNGDMIKSSNLLNEIDCENKEILSIKPDGTINSTNTFNLLLKISKTNNDYNFNVSCNEGSLGFASSYKLVGNNLVIEPNDQEYVFNRMQLTRVFKNAVKVYDDSFTRIIETKDLTLNYVK